MIRFTRRKLLTGAIGGAAAWALWQGGRRLTRGTEAIPQVDPIGRTAFALGTAVSITVLHPNETQANRAIDDALVELSAVEQSLSIYDPRSAAWRFNERGACPLQGQKHLYNVLIASLEMSRRTSGAFDITVQPLWKLYSAAAKDGHSPEPGQIAEVLKFVDYRQFHLSEAEVVLDKPGMAVTFNGIAQGYATDRVKAVLASRGIRHALVDIGELGALGDKSGKPWQAGIQHPRVADAYVAVAQLQDRSLATSGDYATSFSNDHRDHHIFDPATGRSPTELSSVSIAAWSAMEADALSTAVFVMGYERGMRLIRATAGADALFVFKDGKVASTAGFPQQA